MQLKDISHIKPLSQGGNPAGDNWLLEDSSVNRARGAETMTSSEIVAAQADNIIDCQQLARVGLTGGAFAGGGLLLRCWEQWQLRDCCTCSYCPYSRRRCRCRLRLLAVAMVSRAFNDD